MPLDAARGLLVCPLCAGPLTVDGHEAACPAGHRFDVARQGYLNLLGAKPPANADTAPMVAARERFLGSGVYDRIADDVARRLSTTPGPLLEVGAGTGFYAARALGARDARGIALDVSTAAAKRAAQAHPALASVVADAWKTLPLRSGRFGAVLCVFAPRNLPEFARVLADRGLLVVVAPTGEHLASLRRDHGLLGIDDDKDERLMRSAVGLFEPVARNTLRYQVSAGAEQVRDLIEMGPNAFHGVPEGIRPAEIEVAVTVSLFRKLSAGPGG